MERNPIFKKLLAMKKNTIERVISLIFFILSWLISQFKKWYRFLVTHEKILLIFLFLVVVFTRLPWLLFIATDDPGDDSAFYINIGKNLAEGNGYSTDFKEYFYENDGKDNNTDIGDQSYIVPPAYPTLLSLIFLINYSAFTAKVFQTVLFGIFIVIYYKFVKSHFNKKVAFFSGILIAFDPLFFFNSIYAMTDILSVILIISVLYVVKQFDVSDKVRYIYYAAIGVTLAALTREPNGILFPLICGILIYKKKYRAAAIFSIVFFVTLAPWYWYQYINTSYLFPRLHAGRNFPGSPIALPMEKRSSITAIFLFATREDYNLIVQDYLSSGVFAIFLPFMIIGTLKEMFHPKRYYIYSFSLGVSIILIYGFWYTLSGGHANYRYFFPAFAVFFPLGLKVFFDYTEVVAGYFNTPRKVKHLKTQRDAIIILFVIVSVSLSLGTVGMKAYDIKVNEYDDSKSYSWLKENASENSLIATTNPQRCTYFTNLRCVRLPRNVDDFYLEKFISFYNVSYLFVEESYKGGFDSSYNWVSKVFNGTQIISLDSYNLVLVYAYEKPNDNGYAWTYRIEKIQD